MSPSHPDTTAADGVDTWGRPGRPPSWITSADGLRLAVHDFGGPDDDAAPVLLFSHATGFHGQVWEPLARPLTDRYRCLAIDYRGHGLSETPHPASLDWAHLGDDAVALLVGDLIGPGRRIHGIGHSMGGAALVLAAARRPGSFRSLWLYEPVIAAPGLLPAPDGPNPMADGAARRRSSFASFDEAVSNFAAKPPLNELHPDALHAYVRGGFAPQPDGTVSLRCRPSTEAAVFRTAAGNGAWDVLAALALPVAIVAGRDEPNGPVTFVPAAVGALPHGTLVRRPDLGHFGPLEDPEGMAQDVAAWVEAHP